MKKIIIILIIFLSSNVYSQNISNNLMFFQSLGTMYYTNKTQINGISENILNVIHQRNHGCGLSYNLGALYLNKYSFKIGFFISDEIDNFRYDDLHAPDWEYADDPDYPDFKRIHRTNNISTGLSVEVGFNKKLFPKINIYSNLGLRFKYYISDGNIWSAGGIDSEKSVISVSTDYNNSEFNKFMNSTFSLGICKQLRKNNKQFFIELSADLSFGNCSDGTITVFSNNSQYEENGTYIQKGNFIGINTGFIFKNN